MLDASPAMFQATFPGPQGLRGEPPFVVADRERHRLVELCVTEVDDFLSRNGIKTDKESRTNLVKAAGQAFQRAALTLDEGTNGKFSFESDKPSTSNSSVERRASALPIQSIFDGWAQERNPREKTSYTWKKVVDHFVLFLGHNDARQVQRRDVLSWKSDLLSKGLKAKTIQDGKLVPLRAIFQWGINNDLLETNPAATISVDSRINPKEKIRGFTDEEARLILRTARSCEDLDRRWLPWLAAYSGARISEIAQLRKEDIAEEQNIWCLRIKPEAGQIKNVHSERIVPLHSALLAEGFLRFVDARPAGPLFSDVTPDRFKNRGGNCSKRIGKWVRAMGLTDKRLSPNHSWRHRMETNFREYEVISSVGNAILGHAQKSTGDRYGSFSVPVLKRELEKIPLLVP